MRLSFRRRREATALAGSADIHTCRCPTCGEPAIVVRFQNEAWFRWSRTESFEFACSQRYHDATQASLRKLWPLIAGRPA